MATDDGSARYRWYNSSTSHSFAPKSVPATPACDSGPECSVVCSVGSADARGNSGGTADIALFRRVIVGLPPPSGPVLGYLPGSIGGRCAQLVTAAPGGSGQGTAIRAGGARRRANKPIPGTVP